MKTQLQEVNEAITAGEDALYQIGIVEAELDSAKTWGWIDIFSKGGFISAMVKHSRLSEAEDAMNSLRRTIDRFNSEISDIKIYDNVGAISMGTGMELADWLLDGTIIDAITLSRIGDSQRQVAQLRGQIESALQRLYSMRATLENRRY